MLAAFTIFLREGIEGSMIVAILLAYLESAGMRKHFRDVILGVISALIFAAFLGLIIFLTVHKYADTRFQDIFETITYLFAASVMTATTFWMSSHAKGLSGMLKAKANLALEKRTRFGLAAIAFQAVGREGVEAMVFSLAIVFASTGRDVVIGGIVGLAVSLLTAIWIYRLGRKVDLASAFKYLGMALIVFSAGLLVDAIQNLQGLGWLPILSKPLWNTSWLLSQQSTLGDIVHSFFGYSDRPTALQIVVWCSYLALSNYFFVTLATKSRKSPRTRLEV